MDDAMMGCGMVAIFLGSTLRGRQQTPKQAIETPYKMEFQLAIAPQPDL
jgi:hypothetical protein